MVTRGRVRQGTWDTVVDVVICDDIAEHMKCDRDLVRSFNTSDYEGSEGAAFAVHGTRRDRLIIVLRRGRLTPGLVSHEAMHLVWVVMRSIGILLSNDTQEAYCYSLQELVNGIYVVIAKDKLRQKHEQDTRQGSSQVQG